jgi:hypothetical protein
MPDLTLIDVLQAGASAPVSKTASFMDEHFPNLQPESAQPVTPSPEHGIPSARPAQARPQPDKEEFLELDEEDILTLKEISRGRREMKEAQAFLDSHKEYVPNPENWQKIESYLQTHQLPLDRGNIDEAYQVLAGAGMIQAGGVPPRPTRVSTGLSAAGAHAPAIEHEMTQADLSAKIASMPIDQARVFIQKQMYEVNRTKR